MDPSMHYMGLASNIQPLSKSKSKSKPRTVRPNFLMAKEKQIMDAAKILEMDYNMAKQGGVNNNCRQEGVM